MTLTRRYNDDTLSVYRYLKLQTKVPRNIKENLLKACLGDKGVECCVVRDDGRDVSKTVSW